MGLSLSNGGSTLTQRNSRELTAVAVDTARRGNRLLFPSDDVGFPVHRRTIVQTVRFVALAREAQFTVELLVFNHVHQIREHFSTIATDQNVRTA